MKRLMLTLAMAVVVLLIGVVPADAAPPEAFDARITISDIDPCSGQPDVIEIHWTIRVHDDGNGATVLTFKSTVTTATGWSGGGTETQVATAGDVLINAVNIRMTDADGGMYRVTGLRKIDLTTGEVIVDSHRLICSRS